MDVKLQNFKLIVLIFLLFLGEGIKAQGIFFRAIDDLPLMIGLSEIEGETMVFESSSGRIVEVLSSGEVKREQVIRFYSETLPQLGWVETKPGNFKRESEALKIEFLPSVTPERIYVRFVLFPIQ